MTSRKGDTRTKLHTKNEVLRKTAAAIYFYFHIHIHLLPLEVMCVDQNKLGSLHELPSSLVLVNLLKKRLKSCR